MDIWIHPPPWSLAWALIGLKITSEAFMLDGIIFLDPRKIASPRFSTTPTQGQTHFVSTQTYHFFGVMLGLAQLTLSNYFSESSPLPVDPFDLNPDIVGRGVRFSVYGPAVGLVLSSFLGYFHVSDSGAKELAMVQLFTKFEHSYAEFLIVLLLADATSSSLSIALNDKQVLSARMFVYTIGGAQLSMLGIFGWSLANRTDDPVSLGFICVTKALSVTKGVFRSVVLTSAFNIAEREAAGKHRTTPPDKYLKSKRWLGIPIPCLLTASRPLQVQYSEQVATTSVAAFEYIVPTVTSIISAERLMKQATPEGGNWTAWGQMAQLGITVLGLLHFLHTILYQLMYKRRGAFRLPHSVDAPLREYLRFLDCEPET